MNNNEEAARKCLEKACEAWQRLMPVRERRKRYVRYTYGQQWSDIVPDPNGNAVVEGKLMSASGRLPITNNMIRRIVKALVGRFRYEHPVDNPSQTFIDNQLEEVDARTFEEFLISGMAIHHVSSGTRKGARGVWVDNVPPDRFFVSAFTDSRANDVELIGRILDLSIGEVIMRFANSDKQRAHEIKALYDNLAGSGGIFSRTGFGAGLDESFFHPADPALCRVIEIWSLEYREMLRCHDKQSATCALRPVADEHLIRRANQTRKQRKHPQITYKWEVVPTWHCRIMAPEGTVITEFDSPFPDGSHPFAVKLYPLVDGDVHSLVEDVIDQQRYINRLTTLMDNMLSTAAKGVLLFPDNCFAHGTTIEDVARNWADPGGILVYRPSPIANPHQAVTSVSDLGVNQMLQTQMKMLEEASGVSGTLLGKVSGAGVGADRYESEVRNSSIAVSDLTRTFDDFLHTRNRLLSLLTTPSQP